MSNKSIILTMLSVLVFALAATIFFGWRDNKPNSEEVSDYILPIESEQAFLEQMIPHYQAAVDYSEELLSSSVALRPVSEFAEGIVENQSQEIEKMQVWYQDRYDQYYQEDSIYKSRVSSLSDLVSPERERVYLEDMRAHHLATIAAARAVLVLDIRSETKEWAEKEINAKEAEVVKIGDILKLLPSD